jgi:pimeloyl-ACP methyl ester carboxylesterase
MLIQSQIEHRQIKTNGVELHVVEAGRSDGKPVILLHGFPEFWMAWINQIDALVDAGYRVLIPDQRGYHTSDKPRGIKSYATDTLVEDIRGLIEAAAGQPVYLLAHDWGGVVAWRLANQYPELIKRQIILNAPHFKVMRHHLRTNARQFLRSWYIYFFQLPWIPEFFLERKIYRALEQALCSRSRPGSFSPQEIECYREAWKQKGALTAMLNWYRAALRVKSIPRETYRIKVPTLLVWGVKDHALGSEMAQPSIELCDDGEVVLVEEAGHWILHEEPQRVNELIRHFLRK